ncbi:MAG TPA: NAD+ synthase [Rhodanobacteraceae bacterium]|jgi:NAD+ synthase (glutamine-hydrolysing)|nr:NAD+ synthase [Rhodanobacteraceae bacterium]
MAILHFALAQFDFPVGAIARNGERVRELIGMARERGAQLVAFPELTLSGYPPEDLLLRPSFLAACERELAAVAAATNGIAAYVGHPYTLGEVYNAASLLADGATEFTVRKQALPNYTVFDEKRYFRPGNASTVSDFSGVRVGWLVCEDIWEPEPAAHAAGQGAELLIVINASPFDVQKSAQREELLAQRARENNVAIAYLNLIGGQDDLLFDGGSVLIEPDGHVAARAPVFVDALLLAEYDSASRRFSAIDWPVEADPSREARVYAGLVRGIRDYVDKNHFPGVLLGLSGGIDSALTLALAVDALGADRVTAVRLPSHFTSDLSNDLAEVQARTLGVQLLTIPIAPPFNAALDVLGPAFAALGALLPDSTHQPSAVSPPPDVTEENLQSRCRGIVLMALSNKFGKMLLSTGNKSEYAVGYATIYGDMCGGYAPLKDCYKQLVYALARWRNGESGMAAWGNAEAARASRLSAPSPQPAASSEAIPQAVIDRAPSAELRENQTDQDSLPPYEVLDAILERFIDGEQSQAEIIANGFDEATVRRVARLVLGSEYKRRQSAPGPKISVRAFGRDRRYPITSGWR